MVEGGVTKFFTSSIAWMVYTVLFFSIFMFAFSGGNNPIDAVSDSANATILSIGAFLLAVILLGFVFYFKRKNDDS